jgi:hypothetical protein
MSGPRRSRTAVSIRVVVTTTDALPAAASARAGYGTVAQNSHRAMLLVLMVSEQRSLLVV